MNNYLLSSSFKKLLFLVSATALLLLVVRLNKLAIIVIAAWAVIILAVSRRRVHNLTANVWLLCILADLLMVLMFYYHWQYSLKLKAVADLINMDEHVLLAIIVVLLGITAIWSLTAITSFFSEYISDISIRPPFEEVQFSIKETFMILLTAVLTITLLSKSSPCYPLNDWVDTNIFLSVGKSILHGHVLYVDIYEQKGPLLFFIFILPALISETSFIGVYFLEIISCFFFLYYSYKIARFFSCKESLLFLPAYAFIIFSTISFAHGGSVEELCLPFFTCSIYFLLDMFKTKNESLPIKRAFIVGVFIGCVFWIKYTMLGLFFGMALIIIVLYCKDRSISELWRTALAVIAGFFLVSVPVLVYFIANDALSDLWHVYFYNNLFLYNVSDNVGIIQREISNFSYSLYLNKAVFLLVLFGALALVPDDRKLFVSYLLCMLSAAFLIFVRTIYIYYPFLLCAFAPVGYGCICRILKKHSIRIKNSKITLPIAILCALAICISCFHSSTNRYLFGESKKNLPQYKMAVLINESEEKTILNYGILDVGLYTTTGTVPNTRYFCRFNVQDPDQYLEQDRYIAEGIVNFVVTRDSELIAPNYTMIDIESYHFEGQNHTYYLYQRNTK